MQNTSQGKNSWDSFKEKFPITAGLLGVAPVTGQVTAVMDYHNAMRDGNTAQAQMAALGVIPGFKLAKYGSQLAPPSLRFVSRMNPLERFISPATKNAPLIGNVNNGADVGEAAAQTYKNNNNNQFTDPRPVQTMARYGSSS